MTTTEQPPAVDMDKLMGFAFRAVGDIGATVNTALVVMGDRLGLYRAMTAAGPLTPAELAQRTGTLADFEHTDAGLNQEETKAALTAAGEI